MATLSAIKNLGKSIASDLRDAKDSVAASIDRARTERAALRDFRDLLRADPLLTYYALHGAMSEFTEATNRPDPSLKETDPKVVLKPARKPRAKKPATA